MPVLHSMAEHESRADDRPSNRIGIHEASREPAGGAEKSVRRGSDGKPAFGGPRHQLATFGRGRRQRFFREDMFARSIARIEISKWAAGMVKLSTRSISGAPIRSSTSMTFS